MSLVFPLLFVAGAAVTWLHLSMRAQRRGRPFPSVQHLSGALLPRRPTWPVEQSGRLALRLAAVALVALALWGWTRSGRDLVRMAIVDPAAAEAGWGRARALPGVELRAGFEGARPRVEGDDARAARARASLGTCSDRTADCLLRAARAAGARPVVVSAFEDGAWSAALTAGPFDFVRLPPTVESATPSRPRSGDAAASGAPAPLGSTRADASSAPLPTPPVATSTGAGSVEPALALWRSALASVGVDLARGGASRPALLVRTDAGPSVAPCPGVERAAPRGLHWGALEATATGRSASAVGATLRFLDAPGSTPHLDGLGASVGVGTAGALCVAATERELGRWAHDGTLLVLAKALSTLLMQPIELPRAPPGGDVPWLDTSRHRESVGLTDVPPARYVRADGRFAVNVERPPALVPEPLGDGDLVARGGVRWVAPRMHLAGWPLWALLLALLLRAADLPERSARPTGARIAQLIGLAILVVAALGVGRSLSPVPPRWIRIVGSAPDGLESLFSRGGLQTIRGAEALPCSTAPSEAPCIEAARAGTQLVVGVDTQVVDASAPDVELVDVQSPPEVALGLAAEFRVDIRVRRGRGRVLRLSARSPTAPEVRSERPLTSDDEVLRLTLPVLPAVEGATVVGIRAQVDAAEDAQVRLLVARKRTMKRLLLAGAPSWEARRATEVLDVAPARVELITRVGRTALLSRLRAGRSPSELFASKETLDGLASVTLVDVGDWLDPAALIALTAWVERGGGLVVLGTARLPATLEPGPEPRVTSAPASRVEAVFGESTFSFQGFAPENGRVATAAAVLGEAARGAAARHPWIVGRALGRGRVVRITAPDVWRLSPPGQRSHLLADVLGRTVAWVEAATNGGSAVIEDDLGGVVWTDGDSPRRTPFGLGLSVLGVPLGALPTALDAPVRLRAEAARAGRPWVRAASWNDVVAAWERVSEPGPLSRREPWRAHPGTWVAWAALLVAEIAFRRRRTRAAAGVDAGAPPA